MSLPFLLRDDDVSFWTSLDEIKGIYDLIFKKRLKISVAVIPRSYLIVNPDNKEKFYLEKKREFVYKNRDLVSFLCKNVRNGMVEILLHGYDHGFWVKYENRFFLLTFDARQKLQKKFSFQEMRRIIYPEFAIGKVFYFRNKIKKGLEILNKTFSVNVKSFVAPQERMCFHAACALSAFKLNISGILETKIKIQRPLSGRYLLNFLKVLYFKKRFSKPYPYILVYPKHKELVAYHFTQTTNLADLKRVFVFCEKIKAPFCLAFHSWQLIKDPNMFQTFFEFCDFVLTRDISSVTFNEIFN